jgi:hypothetical protein
MASPGGTNTGEALLETRRKIMSKYRISQTGSKNKPPESTFPIIIPPGYYTAKKMFRAPRTRRTLQLRVGKDELISTLRLDGEVREPREAITMDHPVVVKLLANYFLVEKYAITGGITVYDYAHCPDEDPGLVQTGPSSFVVVEPAERAAGNGERPTAIPAISRASEIEAWDLQIASKKYGRGSTSQPDAPIAWWQVRGKDKETPAKPVSLISGPVMKKLMNYELVKTIAREFEIIRQYRKIGEAAL